MSSYHFDKPCLVYDGICNLCATAARILYALDHGWRLDYVPCQQLPRSVRVSYGLTNERLQGQMHLIQPDNSIVSGPVAIAEICKLLGAPVSCIRSLLGTHQARRFYDWIARRRYRIFGCRDDCYVVR